MQHVTSLKTERQDQTPEVLLDDWRHFFTGARPFGRDGQKVYAGRRAFPGLLRTGRTRAPATGDPYAYRCIGYLVHPFRKQEVS